MQPLYVNHLIKKFNFKTIYTATKPQFEIINVPGINRVALELVGYSNKNLKRNTGYLGHKEGLFLDHISPEEREKGIVNLLQQDLPVLILGVNFGYDKLVIEIAKKINCRFHIIKSHVNTSLIFNQVAVYIEYKLADRQEFHASLLSIFGMGIIITGDSGIGKSELSLDLIKNGHPFIADDRVVVSYYAGKLMARSHPLLKDLLEIRGLGLLNIRDLIGSASIINSIQLFGNVHLLSESDVSSKIVDDRLRPHSDNIGTLSILNHNIYKVTIPVLPGRNLVLLTE